MGFMTEVSILNDRWDEIRKNPVAFVADIYEHSATGGHYYRSYAIGQTTVAPTHHADDLRVYFSRGNSFFDAYPDKKMSGERLKMHISFLKDMRSYIKIAETATKKLIAKGEASETQ